MAGKEQTGTRDGTFDLISVSYHALQAAETIGKYCDDAREDASLPDGSRQRARRSLRSIVPSRGAKHTDTRKHQCESP